MGAADLHLRRVLAAMAGPAASPRADQTAAVAALVEQRARALVVQATGWGKSAVYWAATSALRAEGRGPSLDSPLQLAGTEGFRLSVLGCRDRRRA